MGTLIIKFPPFFLSIYVEIYSISFELYSTRFWVSDYGVGFFEAKGPIDEVLCTNSRFFDAFVNFHGNLLIISKYAKQIETFPLNFL